MTTEAISGIGTAAPAGRRVVPVSELPELVGQELGVSAWHEITQSQITAFAEATGDRQWIHVDPERAATGPFGSTIAHGYLTLALATAMTFEAVEFTGATLAINQGLDKVRFKAPVPVGSRVRARVSVAGHRRRGRQFVELVLELVYELEGSSDVPCTARTVTLLQPAS